MQVLVTACLLAGVFAMHGLTGNHDASMALAHGMNQAQPLARADLVLLDSHQPSARTSADGDSAHHGLDAMPAAPDARSSAAQVSPVGPVVRQAHEGSHSMGDLCLAMLTALALAAIIALARRSLLVSRPVAPSITALRVITTGRAPPWMQPGLTKLCVLRI